MKGVDEFVYLVIIALVILGILMFIPFGTVKNNSISKIVDIKGIGRIGLIENRPATTLKYESFNLNNIQMEEIKYIEEVSVERTYFSNKDITFEIEVDENIIDTLKDVKIDFYVDNTNNLGELFIEWNGNVIVNKKLGIAKHEFVVDKKYVKNRNTIKIYASTPGIFFWTGTYYKIKKLRIIAEYGPTKYLFFDITSDHFNAFSKGIVKFKAVEIEEGDIEIYLNNYKIFDGKPSYENTIEFSRKNAYIGKGTNTLAFKSRNGTFRIKDIELDIYLSSNIVNVLREFELDENSYNKLKSGAKLNISISDIEQDGIMTIKINGKNINIQSFSTGENIYSIDGSLFNIGKNTIEISCTCSAIIDTIQLGL